MALIECPECQRQISDMAAACPHCGHPTAVRDDYPRGLGPSDLTAADAGGGADNKQRGGTGGKASAGRGGGAGRTVSALNAHDGLKRLKKVGYVEDHGTSFDLVSYRITERGEDALSEALRFM